MTKPDEGMRFLMHTPTAEFYVHLNDLCEFLESLNLSNKTMQNTMDRLAAELRKMALGA